MLKIPSLFLILAITFSFIQFTNQTLYSTPVDGEGIEKTKTLILLHFDVNKTLVAVDPASNQSIDQILNLLLADKFIYKWSSDIDQPISYKTYVEEHLYPGPSYDQNLKKKRRTLINEFVKFVQETHHPLENQVVESFYHLKKKLDGNFIFPSFLNLINKAKEQNIQFCIILRTFGSDLDIVASSITEAFPDEAFTAKGYFQEGKLYLTTETSEIVLNDMQEAYLYFKSHRHIAIQDNWDEWNEHQESIEYAKRFPMDLDEKETLSLFFDDNILVDGDTDSNIVAPINIKTYEFYSIPQLIDQKILFRVDTFEAIMDDNYFIDLINQSLENSGKSFRIEMTSELLEINN